MKKLQTFLLLIVFLCPLVGHTQQFELRDPSTIKLEKEEDYPKYNDYIVSMVGWLERTPVTADEDKRKMAAAFLIEWLTGAPHVSVAINEHCTGFSEKNKELLLLYMGGWSRYVIQTKDTTGRKGNYAGLKTVVSAYKKGNGYQKDPEMDKLVKLEQEGKLEAWADKQFAMP